MSYSTFRLKKDAKDKKNIMQSIVMMLENLKPEAEGYEKYEIKQFGRLLEVEAYYHEVDEYYTCVGLEVEVETQFAFGEGENRKLGDVQTQVGFYSTWVGKAHEAAPITFEESYRKIGEAHRFDNGLGDHVTVMKELASVEEVQLFAKQILAKN